MIYADQCTILCASASFISGIQNPFATPSQASRYPHPVVSGRLVPAVVRCYETIEQS